MSDDDKLRPPSLEARARRMKRRMSASAAEALYQQSAAEVRANDAEWAALYDALELTGDDRTPEGAARWARTYVAMARRSGWL